MRLLIADDHALFRDSLRSLLSAHGIEVVGEAGTGLEALALTRRLEPEVVLMDLTMPDMDGIEATRRIVREVEGVKVVMLTASSEDEDLLRSVRAGAQGYLQKDLKAKDLLDFLHGMEEGMPALSPGSARKLMLELAKPSSERGRNGGDTLTDREKEVLQAMVEGITTNRDLSQHLGVSENTIKFHIRNILDKLHLHNRTEAVSHAVRHRLVGVNGR